MAQEQKPAGQRSRDTGSERAFIGAAAGLRAGAEIARCLADQGLATPLLRLGLPDRFVDHGDSAVLLSQLGLDATGIVASVRKALGDNS